jgi:hypothetical protein
MTTTHLLIDLTTYAILLIALLRTYLRIERYARRLAYLESRLPPPPYNPLPKIIANKLFNAVLRGDGVYDVYIIKNGKIRLDDADYLVGRQGGEGYDTLIIQKLLYADGKFDDQAHTLLIDIQKQVSKAYYDLKKAAQTP